MYAMTKYQTEQDNSTATKAVISKLKETVKLTRPTHRRTDANMYPPERKLTKASEPSFDLEGGAKGPI